MCRHTTCNVQEFYGKLWNVSPDQNMSKVKVQMKNFRRGLDSHWIFLNMYRVKGRMDYRQRDMANPESPFYESCVWVWAGSP